MDREADFRRVYDAHRGAVYGYLIGRTGDRQAAADLLQEVFTRAWRHLDKLAGMPGDGQRAWIFTVARNLLADVARRRHARAGGMQAAARELAAGSGQSGRGPAEPPSTAVIAAERIAVVGEAIRRLPDQQRVVLSMAAAGGLSSTEIGVALGIPAGTVRYRLSLARRSLARALDRYDDAAEER
jgi:RNA polymerase sigma-70 factor, ECF subfamily